MNPKITYAQLLVSSQIIWQIIKFINSLSPYLGNIVHRSDCSWKRQDLCCL